MKPTDADESVNSDVAIALAGPVAERWRDALTVAINASPDTSWRSVDLQVAFLTGAIAEVIDRAIMAERERCAKVAESNNEWPQEGEEIATAIRKGQPN